jgi:DNA-binding response OmpR family regulator
MAKILIVEDDMDILNGLEVNLSREGYHVLQATEAEKAISLCVQESPELVILDVMLPGRDGFEVCKDIRHRGFRNPIIFLTARAEEIDRVIGLEIGADDYMTKPFGIRELLARIRARLRGASISLPAEVFALGDVTIDLNSRRAYRNGVDLYLTGLEFELLRYFISFRGQTLTRDRLLDTVWGYRNGATSRTVDTHIQRLRKKIERDPANPSLIVSVYGAGYLFTGRPGL